MNLERLGAAVQVSTESLPVLAHREAAWIVVEGRIDIFLCARSAEGELGARHHFLRVEQGNAAFGIELEQPGFAFTVTASPSTRVLFLPLSELHALIAAQDEDARLLVENWIAAVGARFCLKKPPLTFVDACAQTSISLADETRVILASEGVMWVRHRRGESQPLGDARFVKVNGTGYFPVSRFAWIQATPASELDALSTFSLAAIDASWDGLHAFHAFIERLLQLELAQSLKNEGSRIRQRSSLNAVLIENALHRLTTPIKKPRSRHENEQGTAVPIFMAFEVVAAEMGIKLTLPSAIIESPKVLDAIGLIAKASSVRVRKVALKGEWFKEFSSPLLCFMEEDQRPVAVLARSSSIVEVYDPATKTFTRLDEDLAMEINPIAYMVYRQFPSHPLKAFDLIKFGLYRSGSDLQIIALTGIAVGMLAIVTPFVTGIIFDRIIPGAELGQLSQTVVLLLVVAVASSMFMFVRGFAALRLQGKMDVDIQAAVWDRLLALPVSFFRDYTAGDLAQRSMGISKIREMLTGSVLNAVLSGIFSIFSFGLLFFYSFKLAILATLLVLFASAVSVAGGVAQVRYTRRILEISGELSSKLLQFMSGIAKFKVSGTEGRAFVAWAREFSRQKQSAVGARSVSNLLLVFNAIFPTLCLIVIFYANAHFYVPGQKSELSTGQFLAFLAAFSQFLVASLTLSGTLVSVLGIVPIYERTKPILQTVPETSDKRSNPGTLSGEIEINHVSFSYRPDSPLVLRDVTLRIGAGEAVAFVGASGCGKSTLLRLLLGFERPGTGTVYYDGQDLAGVDVQALRRQIGVVLQTSKPIGGSIFDNIVGSLPLTIDDAWEACRLAGLDEDIRRMPMGLHTYLSDGGGGISGGQKQRLMIARAIVAKPRLLLFDEATSALDNRTQAIVGQSLAGLHATRIVIAHRLSTVVNMDKIFVLDKGMVAESGTYQELMERKRLFYQLAKRQLT